MSGVGCCMFPMPTPAELLAFEGEWPRWSSRKDEAIRARFHITPARYFMLTFRAAASLEGQAAEPVVAHRVLRHLRATRRAQVPRPWPSPERPREPSARARE
ncbi:DUF3263 domain-containing protein [Microbacterium enclense]|uniref:DUF3263 domain-containing protein n=1 Tax=Microbacterium enclense TaxID=993073 RepID=UPI0034465057